MSKVAFPSYDPLFLTGYKGSQPFVATTPVFRLDWFNLLSMQQPDEQNELKEPEYNAQCLFAPEADFTILKQIAHDAKVKKFGSDETKWPELTSPFKDQGKIKKQKEWHVPGAAHFTIKAGQKSVERNGPPQLVDIQGNPIKDSSALYRGCFARAVVRAYGYNYKNKNYGVSFGLVGIQKIGDADPFFERINAKDEFKPVQPPAANPGMSSGGGAGSLFD